MIKVYGKLNYFWMPEGYYNTTASGLDGHSMKKKGKDYYWFYRWLDGAMRDNIPYPDTIKKIPRINSFPHGFADIVNDALEEVRNYRVGMLYTKSQIVEFLKFIPDVIIEADDGVYWVKKE